MSKPGGSIRLSGSRPIGVLHRPALHIILYPPIDRCHFFASIFWTSVDEYNIVFFMPLA